MAFTELSTQHFPLNPLNDLAKQWMLITAGTEEGGYNTMTASWGHFGSLWGNGGGLPTAVIYVRPQRYTKEFLDREPYFTLSFFPEQYKKALGYLGSHSGRDGDKIAAAGLTPCFDGDAITFEESNLTLLCRKLYQAPLVKEGFVDSSILQECYPNHDLHEVYIGQVLRILTKA